MQTGLGRKYEFNIEKNRPWTPHLPEIWGGEGSKKDEKSMKKGLKKHLFLMNAWIYEI